MKYPYLDAMTNLELLDEIDRLAALAETDEPNLDERIIYCMDLLDERAPLNEEDNPDMFKTAGDFANRIEKIDPGAAEHFRKTFGLSDN